MHEGRVAACQLQLQLQLEVLLLHHAYFTVPLRHQVSTVSPFHAISLARVASPALCLFCSVCALRCATCVHVPRSFQVRRIKLFLLRVNWSLTLPVRVCVCLLEKVQYVRVCVGLAQVAERHSVRDFAYFEMCCNPITV